MKTASDAYANGLSCVTVDQSGDASSIRSNTDGAATDPAPSSLSAFSLHPDPSLLDANAYRSARLWAPALGGLLAILLCLALAIFFNLKGLYFFVIPGVFIGLPAYVFVGLPAFRFAILRSAREGLAVVFSVICAGQAANILAYPLYFLVALLLTGDPGSAHRGTLGYMIGGATFGLLNCIAFGWIYKSTRHSTKPLKGN